MSVGLKHETHHFWGVGLADGKQAMYLDPTYTGYLIFDSWVNQATDRN
ncbi:hypothetical protein ACKFKH_30215 [Phormidesmis sp. 146-20]